METSKLTCSCVAGIRVDKTQQMVGSYGPCKSAAIRKYEFHPHDGVSSKRAELQKHATRCKFFCDL